MLSGTSWLLSPLFLSNWSKWLFWHANMAADFAPTAPSVCSPELCQDVPLKRFSSSFCKPSSPCETRSAQRPSLPCALSLWLAWRQCCVIWRLIRATATQLNPRFPNTDNRLLMWNINTRTLSHNCSFYRGHSSSSVTEERPLYFWVCRPRLHFGQQCPGLALSGLSKAQRWVEMGWIRGMWLWCGPNNAASIHTADKTQFSPI